MNDFGVLPQHKATRELGHGLGRNDGLKACARVAAIDAIDLDRRPEPLALEGAVLPFSSAGLAAKGLFILLLNYLKSKLPEGIQMKLDFNPGASPAVRATPHSPAARAFAKAMEEVVGEPSQCILSGGSISIVAPLAEASGAETFLLGFGLTDDQIHAPNEHFGVDRLKLGATSFARALEHLGHS